MGAPPPDPPPGPPDPWAPPVDPTQYPPGQYPPGQYPPGPPPGAAAPASGRKAGARLIPLAIGVVLLLVVGVLAVRALTGSDGGSDSPEAAVQQMVDSIAAEDPIAMVASMNPDEVRVLGDLVAASQEKVAELGFADQADPWSGADAEVVTLQTSTEELADGVVQVNIDELRIDWEVDPDATSDRFQEVIEAGTEEGEEPEAESGRFDENDLVVETDEGDEVDPFLVVVETDGGWYVSPMYTAAQYIAVLTDTDPDFDAVDEVGDPGETPTDAVERLALAVGNLDVDAGLAVLPSDELAPLRAYRGVVERELQDAIDEGELDEVEFSLSNVDTTEEDLGDGATKVVIDGFEGEFAYSSEGDEIEGTFAWDGTCLTSEVTEDGDTEEEESCVEPDERDAFGIDQFFVVTVEERGGHVVSPVATLLEYWSVAVESLDEAMIMTAFGAPQLLDPSATLAPGDSGAAEFTSGGVAVVDLQLEAGADYVLGYDEADDEYWYWDLYLDGEYVDYGSNGGLVSVDDDGTYRAVISGGSPGATTDVTLSELDPEQIELPANVAGSVGAGDTVAYEFEVDGSVDGDLRIDVVELTGEDYGSLLLVDPDGYSVSYYDGENETTSPIDGTWRLIISGGTAGFDYDVDVSISEPDGFEGGDSSTTVTVAPGRPVTVPITLTEGSEVDISAYPGEIADIRLVLFDPAATPIEEMNDWTFGSESIDVDEVPASGTYLLEVSTLDAATDVDIEVSIY